MDNLESDYINYPGDSTWGHKDLTKSRNRELTKSRNMFLEFIGENRTDIDSYKKYLIIRVTGTEILNISNNNHNFLLKRNIPQWVIDDTKEGKRVEAILYVDRTGPNYFRHKNNVFLLRKNSQTPFNNAIVYHHISNDYISNVSTNITFLNNTICGVVDITNVIVSKINKDGTYDQNINEISKQSGKTIDELERSVGKIKPIYFINIENLKFFPTFFPTDIFMRKFNVKKNKEKYELIPIKLLDRFKFNVVTVWI
jgi:hypothetical protein